MVPGDLISGCLVHSSLGSYASENIGLFPGLQGALLLWKDMLAAIICMNAATLHCSAKLTLTRALAVHQDIPCSPETAFSSTGFLCLGRALHQHLQINFIILFQIIYTLYREFGQYVDWYTYLILVLSCQSNSPVYSYLN